MPRAITFDSRLRTRSFCKHASTYSVRKIALAVATSKTSRWIDTLLGQTYDGFWIYHEDLCDTSVRTMHPEKSKAVPLYYAERLRCRNLAEHLIVKPENLNAKVGKKRLKRMLQR